MKLRYRLFFWVGLLFVIAFAISFYVEAHVTRVDLIKTRQKLIQRLDEIGEKKRESIKAYVSDLLWKIQARIDSVLQGVANYPLVQQGFAPSQENLKNGTWLDAASLMITNQWLGFVQNVSNENLMSEIVVHSSELSNTYHFPIDKDIHLIAIQDLKNPKVWKGPYIGVSFDLSAWHRIDKITKDQQAEEDYFVFFTPQALLKLDLTTRSHTNIGLSVNLLEPFLKWVEIPYKSFHFENFIQSVKKAQDFIKNNSHLLPTNEEWNHLIEKKLHVQIDQDGSSFSYFPYFSENVAQKDQNYRQEIFEYMKNYIEHYNKIGLVWGVCALTDTQLFGNRPIGPEAPFGIGIVDSNTFCGKGLQGNTVFRRELQYDVEKKLKGLDVPEKVMKTHLDVVVPKNYHHIFFVNTLKLENPLSKEASYLTLGVHGEPILSTLARATDQISMFVSQNHIVAVSNPSGERLSIDSPWFQISTDQLLGKNSGTISVNGQEYFFLHIVPYKEIDLHFFVFNPKAKEFQLVDSINESTENLIDKLSIQMRISFIAALIFVLFLLNNIAKRVTKPITYLAQVTQIVTEGKLHEIQIPKEAEKEKRRRDEVDTLYHAFFAMVKGLREKEKVRGVLNKVVSKEIAEQTLRGNIQLGGEERRVTMFFADIRNFTSITEKMDPKDVIQLINNCMTRVSQKIDKYGGVIDKYVGDEIMALFGAPIEKEDGALCAIQCAVDILEDFNIWNATREIPIELGIGVHTGIVVAGNMGAEDRLNYTVLGANVNLASRLCDRAKPMQILISKDTLLDKSVENNVDVEELAPIELKGFTHPVSIYAVKTYKRET